VDVKEGQVPNAVEILPKISTAGVGCTRVTDDRQTDGRQQIANVNSRSRSLKINLRWSCAGPPKDPTTGELTVLLDADSYRWCIGGSLPPPQQLDALPKNPTRSRPCGPLRPAGLACSLPISPPLFSERELTFTICCRLPVCRLFVCRL